jgi:TonB-dependent receptor
MEGKEVRDPALWSEDLYFRTQSSYTGTRGVTESVTAAYLMSQARLGQLGILAGVRGERTEDESYGWVRARIASTAAQQAADPVGAATRDYAGSARRLTGRYEDLFPSAHLTYALTRQLKARASGSTSFGRPVFTNLLPNETANEAQQTLTINNAALKPQYAKNWDLGLEYYFEPVGQLSAGWFQKTITDYIVSGINAGTVGTGNGNGFNGEYPGFTMLTTANAGTAYVQGWELSYQQQFTFLPGALRGLGVAANFTTLTTHGDFGGTTRLSTNDVAGFIPRSTNLSLVYKYRAISTNVLLNRTGRYLQTASTSAGRVIYRAERTTVNLGLAWQPRSAVSVFCNVTNLFNEPQRTDRFSGDQMERSLISGTTLTCGVSGRF